MNFVEYSSRCFSDKRQDLASAITTRFYLFNVFYLIIKTKLDDKSLEKTASSSTTTLHVATTLLINVQSKSAVESEIYQLANELSTLHLANHTNIYSLVWSSIVKF